MLTLDLVSELTFKAAAPPPPEALPQSTFGTNIEDWLLLAAAAGCLPGLLLGLSEAPFAAAAYPP